MFDRIDKGLWWDRAWQLVQGCTKVSKSCLNCWSEKQYRRFSSHKTKYKTFPKGCTWDGEIKMLKANLDLPIKIKKPTVFAIWNDLFHGKVSFEFIEQVFQRIRIQSHHVFLILTKRPEIAAEFFRTSQMNSAKIKEHEIPSNFWLGTTVESAEHYIRIEKLLEIEGINRFLSLEPMLSELDIAEYLKDWKAWEIYKETGREVDEYKPTIHWVIAGGESGKNARPSHPDWFRKIRDDCKAVGVPFFFKQWGEYFNGAAGKKYREITVMNNGDVVELTGEAWEKYHKEKGGKWNDFSPAIMSKTGKKKAGKVLNDKEYLQIPEV